MTKLAEKIFDEVLMLDTDERLELVNRLQREFGPKEPGYDEAWTQEISRREEAVIAGTAKFVPAEEVLATMDRMIKEKRASADR